MKQAMEQQAAAERERRAIETIAEGRKNAMILDADGKLESARREALAQIRLAEASAEAINNITSSIKGEPVGAMFLLGNRYISTLRELSKSENSKLVVYPADLQESVKGIFRNFKL